MCSTGAAAQCVHLRTPADCTSTCKAPEHLRNAGKVKSPAQAAFAAARQWCQVGRCPHSHLQSKGVRRRSATARATLSRHSALHPDACRACRENPAASSLSVSQFRLRTGSGICRKHSKGRCMLKRVGVGRSQPHPCGMGVALQLQHAACRVLCASSSHSGAWRSGQLAGLRRPCRRS